MKKNLLIAAGVLVLILSGCGNKATESQTPEEFLQEIDAEWEREQAEREQEVMEQAAAEDGYVEGIIPAGRYYVDGDTSNTYWTFYTDAEGVGCFMINEKITIGTYTYDPETGIYSIDYNEKPMGGMQFLYEGYFREEDFCFVRTRTARIDKDEEYTISEEGSVTEFYRIEG